MVDELTFGLKRGVPDARAKWGARLIVEQTGHVDVVPGRTSECGEEAALVKLFARMDRDFPMPKLRDVVREKLLSYELNTREAALVKLFDDGDLVVLGNTNASAGYLYVAAFRRCDTFGSDTPDEYREKPPGAMDPLPKYMNAAQYRDLMANYD